MIRRAYIPFLWERGRYGALRTRGNKTYRVKYTAAYLFILFLSFA